jgi:hypothetical protein
LHLDFSYSLYALTKFTFPSRKAFTFLIRRLLFNCAVRFSRDQSPLFYKIIFRLQAVMLVNFHEEMRHIVENGGERVAILRDIKEKPPHERGLNFLYFYFS